MKTSFATTALVIAMGLSASASFAAYGPARTAPAAGEGPFAFTQQEQAPSALTRGAVRSEYQAARNAGALPANGEVANVQGRLVPSTLSRATVRADFFQAQRAGTLPATGDRS
jgi:hypothetical protein